MFDIKCWCHLVRPDSRRCGTALQFLCYSCRCCWCCAVVVLWCCQPATAAQHSTAAAAVEKFNRNSTFIGNTLLHPAAAGMAGVSAQYREGLLSVYCLLTTLLTCSPAGLNHGARKCIQYDIFRDSGHDFLTSHITFAKFLIKSYNIYSQQTRHGEIHHGVPRVRAAAGRAGPQPRQV